jgi:hypothetical protein
VNQSKYATNPVQPKIHRSNGQLFASPLAML